MFVFPRSCKFAALICSETVTSEGQSRIIVFLCEWINRRCMYWNVATDGEIQVLLRKFSDDATIKIVLP